MYVYFHVAPPGGYTYCEGEQRREEADVRLVFMQRTCIIKVKFLDFGCFYTSFIHISNNFRRL